MRLQRPIRRNAVEIDVEELLPTVHLPNDGRGFGVAPDEIRVAAAVDDAERLQRPIGRDGVEIDVEELLPAVHLPQHGRAGIVAPDDVGLAVAVEVAEALNL